MSTKRPRVITRCVADHYHGPRERIIEFSGDNSDQGGLISFQVTDEGLLLVNVYRVGADTFVNVGEPERRVQS